MSDYDAFKSFTCLKDTTSVRQQNVDISGTRLLESSPLRLNSTPLHFRMNSEFRGGPSCHSTKKSGRIEEPYFVTKT